MKKILLTVLGFIASASVSAQVLNVFKDGVYVATYTNENGAKVALNGTTAIVRNQANSITQEYSADDGYSFQFRKGNLLGSGTEEDPYIVSDYTDLFMMAEFSADTKGQIGHYKQTCDIDCAGRPLIPIGTFAIPFKGTYDGGGYTISNATYQTLTDPTDEKKDICALFGVTQDVTIKNLKIVTPTFKLANDSRTKYVSPLIGWAFGTDKTKTTTVTKCTAEINWTGKDYIGGNYTAYYYNGNTFSYGGMIACCSSNGNITYCTHSGTIIGRAANNWNFGGIIGIAESINDSGRGSHEDDGLITVDCCRNKASFTLQDVLNIGGIIGRTVKEDKEVNIHVYNCVNTGDFYAYNTDYAESHFGGIVGYNLSGGWTSLIGYVTDAAPYIHNCINNGKIGDDMDVYKQSFGGIVGYTSKNTEVTFCANGGSIDTNCGISGDYIGTFNGCWYYAGASKVTKSDTEASLTNCGSKTASDIVTYMNNAISNNGVSSVYRSWKLTDDGKCDLNF